MIKGEDTRVPLEREENHTKKVNIQKPLLRARPITQKHIHDRRKSRAYSSDSDLSECFSRKSSRKENSNSFRKSGSRSQSRDTHFKSSHSDTDSKDPPRRSKKNIPYQHDDLIDSEDLDNLSNSNVRVRYLEESTSESSSAKYTTNAKNQRRLSKRAGERPSKSMDCDCLHGPSKIQTRWINERLREYEVNNLKFKRAKESESNESHQSRDSRSSNDDDDTSVGHGTMSETKSDSRRSSTPESANGKNSDGHSDGSLTPRPVKQHSNIAESDGQSNSRQSDKTCHRRYSKASNGIKPSIQVPEKSYYQQIFRLKKVNLRQKSYRTRDVSNNAFYLTEDLIVFPAASVGVVMDLKLGTQRFFQGRHTQEIATLSVHPSKRLIVTGDTISNGDATYLYIWDPKAPEDVQRQVQIRVGDKKIAKGVADVCFSTCGKLVIAVSMDENHTVHVYNWQKAGKQLTTAAGHSNTIFGICPNPHKSEEFVTFGVKHLTFWTFDTVACKLTSKAGNFGDFEVMSILSCCFLPCGSIATGTHRGPILIWEKQQVTKALDGVHDVNPEKYILVSASNFFNRVQFFQFVFMKNFGLISGGRDGVLARQNIKTHQVEAKLQSPSGIMSIDFNDKGFLLVGLEGSDLIQLTEFGNEKTLAKTDHRVIVEGHSVSKNQELWGCAVNPKNTEEYATCGDDSMVMIRNIRSKNTVSRAHLQGKLKAITYSPDGKYIAVGNDNGDIFVLTNHDLKQVHFQKYDQKQNMKSRMHSINVLKFSPNGKYLAAGTHDDIVYVWQLFDGFKVAIALKGHSSYITHLDWSTTSDHIQSNSNSEIMCWVIPSGEQIQNAKGVKWQTSTCTWFESTLRGNEVTTVDCPS
ncbi:quinon protein alcohol dehydrogenase-like superfamily [Obelidium mucronatum]|nr:quinon protein alcohol dehydrogenase-like superfamily [Obelidium mucronatum]